MRAAPAAYHWRPVYLDMAINWFKYASPASFYFLAGKLILPFSIAAAVLCGPEAGFSESELRLAGSTGWLPAGLGSRVLRTETAGLVALAVLQAGWGDLR